jgi:hypothetical protein
MLSCAGATPMLNAARKYRIHPPRRRAVGLGQETVNAVSVSGRNIWNNYKIESGRGDFSTFSGIGKSISFIFREKSSFTQSVLH